MSNQLPTITIISGLPRSGTSMMMQLLKLGGYPILTDDVRQQDDNNPKGYFEYEKVKSLHTDTYWLAEAEGKAIKIISHFISYLPSNYHYNIILMQRPISEVLSSQQKMLGKEVTAIPYGIEEVFTKQLEQTKAFIASQNNMNLLCINYNEVIKNPKNELLKISSFLNEELPIAEMIKGVDVSLYRHKSN